MVDAGVKLPPFDETVLRKWFEQDSGEVRRTGAYDFQEAVIAGDRSEAAARGICGRAQRRRARRGRKRACACYGTPARQYRAKLRRGVRRCARSGAGGRMAGDPSREGLRVMRLESSLLPAGRIRRRAGRRAPGLDGRGDSEQRSAAVRALAQKYTVKSDGTETMTLILRVFALLLLALRRAGAVAHEMTMAEMELRETRPGEFLWQWGASGSRPLADELTPSWPEPATAKPCAACGEADLSGELSIEGVGERYSAALVKVFWRDGQSRVYTLTERQPTVHFYGSADESAEWAKSRALTRARCRAHPERFRSLDVRAGPAVPGRFQAQVGAGRSPRSRCAQPHAREAAWAVSRCARLRSKRRLRCRSCWSQPKRCINADSGRRLPALVAFLFGLVHGWGSLAPSGDRPAAESPGHRATHFQYRRRDRAADGSGGCLGACGSRPETGVAIGVGSRCCTEWVRRCIWSWLRVAAVFS